MSNLSFRDLEIQNEYRSKLANVTREFYTPILNEAITYDRAVGFFSSTALIAIAQGLLPFVNRDGLIRLVASPKLSEEDMEAIKSGYEKRKIVADAIKRELYDPTDFRESQRLNLLAKLISDGRLDFKIALIQSENKMGMYHEKMGCFQDQEGNKIAFAGSMNESLTAMDINYESIDVYCEWKNEDSELRVKSKFEAFEKIWNNEDPSVETMEFPEVKEEILRRFKREKNDFQEFDEVDFKIENEICNDIEIKKGIPYYPEGFLLHEYQKEAIKNWEKNDYVGIFDMATGTGKTYTGLGAVVKLSDYLSNKLAVVIVCPYQHLVEQWVEDIEKFNINPIIGYSASRQKNWKILLEDAVRDQKLKVKDREFFCFITTNATYSSEFVQKQIDKIRGNALIMVDEAHNFGAEYLRGLLSSKFNYRLALSATLERHGDEDGTNVLYNYFGNKCIEYSLDRAIEEGKLTPYKYHPIVITLTEEERQKYDEYSKQIQKCLIKGKNGRIKLSEKGKKIALARARLVAGASNKIEALKHFILPYIKDTHILVYCGATKVLNQGQDYSLIEDEDIRQIDLVTDVLGNQFNMKVSQFTSNEDVVEREILKKEFSKGDNLQALIAIKCLDEGVNIPRIKVAFILASTTNPKEYIQRRGRVLRLSEGKKYAEIYDFITLPREMDEVSSLTDEQMKRELTLVKNELCRAEEFARIAMNGVEANIIIDNIIDAYDLQDYIIEYEEEFVYGSEE